MRYTYRCHTCRLTWDTRDDLYDAQADQNAHKYQAHGGARPYYAAHLVERSWGFDDLAVRAGAAGLARGVYRGLTSKSLQKVSETDYFRQAAMLLGGGILILVLIRWLTH
ncbi:hypothetical protein [Streptomyces sp. sk2.1]|uniref:hypothetical protein n=1 Tax=Streptomyces sp. sk2.1 TaxID=2478959 RepID=UPI0011E69709|nr:hypothetical protein [Streptomyces sp. sk2.1]TXS58321.1 hypothetical protein EAO76_43365 [Streptomyces sp. sk2.1]